MEKHLTNELKYYVDSSSNIKYHQIPLINFIIRNATNINLDTV